MKYNFIGDVMKCENLFCIYQSDDNCLLEHIDLDIQGQCKECIYPDIDEEYLKKLKEKYLNKFHG